MRKETWYRDTLREAEKQLEISRKLRLEQEQKERRKAKLTAYVMMVAVAAFAAYLLSGGVS